MNLAQLRNFTASPQYQQYQQLQAVNQSIESLVAQQLPDHATWVTKYQELAKLVESKNTCQALVTAAQQKLKVITDSYRESFKKLEDTNVLSAFYKESLEDVTHQYLDELSKTLTEVYCSVYNKTSKQVQLVLEDYRGKKVVHLKYLNSYEGNLYPESLDEDGGSAQIILGIIISIYFVMATNLPRVMFLDESLSALSTPVLHRFLSILKKFSSELGWVFYIVDHAPTRFRAYVDQLFTVEDGIYREVPPAEIDSFIEQFRGEDDE